MPKTTLGDLELLVMLAILRCGDDAYGVPIAAAIRERTGRLVARAAVYVTLQRLEKSGLVAARLGAPIAERGGRARKYYRVEPAGMDLLRATQSAYENMWAGLELGERT